MRLSSDAGGLRRRWAAFLFAALLAAPLSAAEPRVLVLNDAFDPPFTTADRQGFLDIVAGEAFGRLGLKLRLVKLPAERGLMNANAGIEDGDLARIAGLESQYPNLVRVPEKLVDLDFMAFGSVHAIPSSWAAMRGHNAGFLKGWKIYEQNLAGSERAITADDPEQLLRLLSLGRVEVMLYERWMGLALIERRGQKGLGVIEPPLASREMFIYLHKRHAGLLPGLSGALRALKSEGFYERTRREKLSPYARTSTR